VATVTAISLNFKLVSSWSGIWKINNEWIAPPAIGGQVADKYSLWDIKQLQIPSYHSHAWRRLLLRRRHRRPSYDSLNCSWWKEVPLPKVRWVTAFRVVYF